MKRRDLLVGAGLSTVGLAGCASDSPTAGDGGDEPDSGSYERCGRNYVSVSDLPGPARTELTAAIEDGAYETGESLVLPQAFDTADTYFVHRGDAIKTYYTVETEAGEDGNRLRAIETLPETDPVKLHNRTETAATVDVRVDYGDAVPLDGETAAALVESEGRTLVDDAVDLEAGAVVALERTATYRYGSYRATVTREGSDVPAVVTWVTSEERTAGEIRLTATGDVTHVAGYTDIGLQGVCKWNDGGELIAGPGTD